jgi:RNA polymerase sigma-70 factor (ECF subfamily)
LQRSFTGSFDPALTGVALSLARHFGARGTDAEDIAQEALLKLITYSDTVEEPIAWLYVVVRRLQQQRRRHPVESTPRAPRPIDPRAALELFIDTRRLIRSLTPRQQRSVFLSLAGYTERETAARLGCSIKATEKTLFKARKRLRGLMASG